MVRTLLLRLFALLLQTGNRSEGERVARSELLHRLLALFY